MANGRVSSDAGGSGAIHCTLRLLMRSAIFPTLCRPGWWSRESAVVFAPDFGGNGGTVNRRTVRKIAGGVRTRRRLIGGGFTDPTWGCGWYRAMVGDFGVRQETFRGDWYGWQELDYRADVVVGGGLDAGVAGRRFFRPSCTLRPGGMMRIRGRRGRPLKSWEAARGAVRGMAGKEAVTVWFAGGRYQLAGGVAFDGKDSGTEAAPVLYAAMPGQTVVISGGMSVTGVESGERRGGAGAAGSGGAGARIAGGFARSGGQRPWAD